MFKKISYLLRIRTGIEHVSQIGQMNDTKSAEGEIDRQNEGITRFVAVAASSTRTRLNTGVENGGQLASQFIFHVRSQGKCQ